MVAAAVHRHHRVASHDVFVFAPVKFAMRDIDAALESGDESRIWKAAEQLGELAETEPRKIWSLVEKHGSSQNPEVRQAIATCVLEHVLQFHFDEYFSRVEQLINGGNSNFADTFRLCWKFDESWTNDDKRRWNALRSQLDEGF